MARKRVEVGALLVLLILSFGFLPPSRTEAGGGPTIIYVDTQATGNNDGTSWADAYTNLYAALFLADSGSEIWVSQGTHKPGLFRNHTFTLKSGVALYGGFPTGGGDGTREARDPEMYETILSGDHGAAGDYSDNSYHVVTASGTDETARLDGFTIRDGNADVSGDPKGKGGGIYNEGGSPKLSSLYVYGNHALVGGGMYNLTGDPSLTALIFEDNEANNGAGMYNHLSNPVLEDVLFIQNLADLGAGMSNYYSSPALTDVRFEQNEATDSGGGLYNNHSHPTLKQVRFRENEAFSGGGLYNLDSDPVLTGAVFELNQAADLGGGLYSERSEPVLVDVEFRRNLAQQSGGGAYVWESDAVFVNASFEGNTAGWNGGGLLVGTSSTATLVNVVLSGNHADQDGGGLHNSGIAVLSLAGATIAGNSAGDEGGGVRNESAAASFENTILWGNHGSTGAQMFSTGGTVTLDHSLVQGGCPAGASCPGDLLTSDPRFVRNPDPGDDGAWGSNDDDYGTLGLRRESPAINVGDDDAVPADDQDVDGDGNTTEKLPLDLAGNPRFANAESSLVSGALEIDITGIVDLGAYEAPPSPLYVDEAAPGVESGLSWDNAFTDLQDALQWGRSGAVDIWMAEGVYVPGVNREDTYHLVSGTAIYGGFPMGGSDGSFGARAWRTYTTTLSGDIGVPVDPTGNIYHVITASGVDRSAVLDGLTIHGGQADGFETLASLSGGGGLLATGSLLAPGRLLAADEDCATFTAWGGGLCNIGGSPTLRHLVLRDNFGKRGGAIYNSEGAPLLDDVHLIGNEAWEGGGLLSQGGAPLLIDVVLRGNFADYGGGMSGSWASRPNLINVAFEGNTGVYGGGLYYSKVSTATLTNVIFSGNGSETKGGGMRIVSTGDLALTNVTFSGNVARDTGGGISVQESNLVLANVVLWGNSAPAGAQMSTLDSTVQLDYSLVQDGCPAGVACDHLSTADPQFLRDPDPGTDGDWGTGDDDFGDLRLAETSPAADAGDNDAIPADDADLDRDGNTTEKLPLDLAGGRRFANAVSAPDSGHGSSPIVDLGAYEVQNHRVFLPLVMRVLDHSR